MGLVGSVCLASPDPQKGGELMTLSCVPFGFSSQHAFLISYVSKIHKPFTNGQNLNFLDVYPNYKRAMASPMCSYSSLFYHKKLFFLFTWIVYSLTTWLLASNEQFKWALPGTKQLHSQQEEFAALGYSMPAPVRAIALATSTNPPILSNHMSHAHSSSNGQEA